MQLKGCTALVTGAGKNIGKGIALELAREGCKIAVNDFDESITAQTVAEIEALGSQAFAVHGDVGSSAEVNAMFDRVLARFAKLDILVNNAGVQTWKPLLDLEEAEWDRVINTNLKGCFLCTQRAARHMKDHGGGVIVNLGSGCSKIGFPNLSSYTASKGGIEMFTKVSAAELGPYGIRVNCVAPGSIETDRTRLESGDYVESWSRITPLRRTGTTEDVGRAVAMLASPGASFVTGQTLWVDGGVFSTIQWPYSSESKK